MSDSIADELGPSWTRYAAQVRYRTGLSLAASVDQLQRAHQIHNISPRRFVQDELWNLPEEKWSVPRAKDRFVALSAEKMGVTYLRALSTMYRIRERYGIGFRQFSEQKLYNRKSEESLRKGVQAIIAREAQHLEQVCVETGWTFEEAEQALRETRARWPMIDSRKFVGYGFYAMTEAQVAERIQKWEDAAKANREIVQQATGWPLPKVRSHMARYQVLYNIIPAYYICYKAWELDDAQIDGYARQHLSSRLSAKYNSSAHTRLLGRKDQFDELYSEFVRRKHWVNHRDATFDSFLEFAAGLDKAFVKPLRSGGGLGTSTLNLTGDRQSKREIYDDLVSKPLVLVEELVPQHQEISDFYPGAVNTVRVVAVQHDGEVNLISAGIRFGKSTITDNFSADGMVCDVDLDTGLVLTNAVDKKGAEYDAHPYGGKVFKGFQIPHWDRVIETARGAMEVLDGINYVGWDIAIGPDDVYLIEGNSAPDLVLVQAPYSPQKIGMRHLFDPWLEGPAPRRPKRPEVVSGVERERAPNKTQAPIAAPGQDEVIEVDGIYYSGDGSGGLAVVGADEELSELRLPSVVRGLGVSMIDPGAFRSHPSLVRVDVAAAIEIAPSTFRECRSLETVKLAEGTRLVRSRAFADCTSLTEVSFPESVTKIYKRAFAGCTALQDIELPPRLGALNEGLFDGCASLRRVILPYWLKSIGPRAFSGCVSLESLGYFSMRGISTVLEADRGLFQETLPNEIESLGDGSFRGCRSVNRVDVPSLVREIPARCFEDCASLSYVGLHSNLRSIGARAFAGCTDLAQVRVPPLCSDIAADAFMRTTTLVVGRKAGAWAAATRTAAQVRTPRTGEGALSAMRGTADRFYSSDQLATALETMEIRAPAFPRVSRDAEPASSAPRSRFSVDGEQYVGSPRVAGRARLLMVGDIMARLAQQERASARGARWFAEGFDFVSPLLEDGDLNVCNLESMLSPSAPYSAEMEHVSARPHLNAPFAVAEGLRMAGFDAVVNAQNHAYDAGTRGVYETLDVLNRNGLIHTGLYASDTDPRFVVVNIGGIRVGLVAFLDKARQAMKRVNFTAYGIRTMFPFFTTKEVTRDIAAARAAGAEFIVAYCHWGREYTTELSDRQRGFAQLVADAGADYLVGAHPHCLQRFETVLASDGRAVPCLWSAGNFLSDMNVKPPITRDSLILDVTLRRAGDCVEVSSQTYHPCRIMNLRAGKSRNYFVVPTSTDLGSGVLNSKLRQADARIREVIGSDLRPSDG